MLTVGEKIKIILKRKNITLSELAELINSSRQNLSNKMSRDNFSEKEIKEIAKALNLECEITFKFEDGSTI